MKQAADNTAFGVANRVKYVHKLVWVGYLDLHWVRSLVDPVVLHCLAVDLVEILVPRAELGPQRMQDVVLREACKSLVEPNVVPPIHGDVVAEPHVAELVSHRSTISLNQHLGRV